MKVWCGQTSDETKLMEVGCLIPISLPCMDRYVCVGGYYEMMLP